MRGRHLFTAIAIIALVCGVGAILLRKTPSRQGSRDHPDRRGVPSGALQDGRSGEDNEKPVLDAFSLRDLATGEPIHGASVAWTTTDGDEGAATTDQDGRVGVPPGLKSIRLDEPWALATRLEEIDSGGTAWAFQNVWISGRLVNAGPVMPKKLRVQTIAASVPGYGASPSPSRFPWTRRWLTAHGVRTHERHRVLLNDRGEFKVRFPAVRGLRVVGRISGRQTASDVVSYRLDGGSGVAPEVVLEFRDSWRIRGVLRSSAGKPLVRTLVTAYIIERVPARSFRIEDAGARGHSGYTVGGGLFKGLLGITHHTAALTGKDGAFDIEAKVLGEVILVAWPKGHNTVAHRLGKVYTGVVGIELEADRHDGSSVILMKSGRELVEHRVMVTDLEFDEAQPSKSVTLNKNAELTTAVLIVGHSYYLIVSPPGSLRHIATGEFRYTGQARFDIDDLKEFRRDPR